ncbi:TPA: hypothetical protein ACXNPR_003713 [Enterobacter cancerogenus]
MKQKAAKYALNEFGYLVNVKDFRFPPTGKLYCFYCTHPVVLVPAQDDSDAHFQHVLTMSGRDEIIACPTLESHQTKQAR